AAGGASRPTVAACRARYAASGPPPDTAATPAPRSATSQTRTVPSLDAEARSRPSGDHDTEWTQLECPSQRSRSVPVTASHTRTVPSLDAEARSRPSGDHDTDQTAAECPPH